MAVALPELARTGQLLKQPLAFLDKPAAMYLLTDGLRSSSAASEFCAKRFHAQFLPRLSGRATELEDHEILTIVTEAVESLDHALLESSARYSGCGFALALILGRRLVIGTIGDCRVVLCRPSAQERAKDPWQARTFPSVTKDVAEREGRRLLLAQAPLDVDTTSCLRATSAAAEELATLETERERILVRVARAANPFAVLGTTNEAHSGVVAVRQALERFEELAHPSKVTDNLHQLAIRCHMRMLEAATAVEKMLGMDVYVTQLLAELCNLMDEENGIPSPKRSAALLGVEPGCGEVAAQAAIDRRYRAVISHLAAASPENSAHGFRILSEVADAVARPAAPVIWTPPPGSRAASVTRAMGFRDLKRPRHLMGNEATLEVARLEAGRNCLLLLTDGARGIGPERLGEIATLHRDRPRAACLRITNEAVSFNGDEAVGAIAVYVNVTDEVMEAGTSNAASSGTAAAKHIDSKKRKATEVLGPVGKEPGKPARIRIAHILLKYAGLSEVDAQARRSTSAGRLQADAERMLLELLESLQRGDAKDLTTRFAATCREKSDCKSALNTPHADLGWINPGQLSKELDVTAFELQVGGLSDILLTPRGAHILYRLA